MSDPEPYEEEGDEQEEGDENEALAGENPEAFDEGDDGGEEVDIKIESHIFLHRDNWKDGTRFSHFYARALLF